MVEKRLIAVSPQSLIANGTTNGVVLVTDTRLFKVKQHVILVGTGVGPSVDLEIKRIVDINQLEIGPAAKNIEARSDLSAYTLAANSVIFANEQKRPSIPVEEINRAVYDEEPTVALRTVLVDAEGNKIDDNNPLPVQVDTTVNIGDVRITAQDNEPFPGNIHSSVRISNGINDMQVNTDGSINTVVVLAPGQVKRSFYNEITSVPAATPSTVLTYTVPVATSALLMNVYTSGSNMSIWTVLVNDVVVDKKREYWSGAMNENFSFDGSITLNAGDILTVSIIHNGTDLGEFNSKLYVIEQT